MCHCRQKATRKRRLQQSRYRFDRAFTSRLIRATDTLKIVLAAIGQSQIPIEENQALNERMYGDLQGLNKDETIKKYGAQQVELWRRSYDVRPPGGESLQDMAARVMPYYEERITPALDTGDTVLLVAHGNSLRALVMHLEHLSPPNKSWLSAFPQVHSLCTPWPTMGSSSVRIGRRLRVPGNNHERRTAAGTSVSSVSVGM